MLRAATVSVVRLRAGEQYRLCSGATRCSSGFSRQAAVGFRATGDAVGQRWPSDTEKYLVRAAIGEFLITVFPDGRAVIGGTEEIAVARSVYAKYVGN